YIVHLSSSFFLLFFSLLHRRPPPSPLFPYTTLFRSAASFRTGPKNAGGRRSGPDRDDSGAQGPRHRRDYGDNGERKRQRLHDLRSEEHTSELQSLRHLVCRLLLEKKKATQR